MAVPRGVTFTLSDYRALGPPFPGGYPFAISPFGGELALGSSFPFYCLPVFKLILPPPGNGGLRIFHLVTFLSSLFHPFTINICNLILYLMSSLVKLCQIPPCLLSEIRTTFSQDSFTISIKPGFLSPRR